MKLVIAEKPSLAKAIAEGLPGSGSRGDGFIEKGEYTVTWCFGHLLELKKPDEYNPQYKNWGDCPLPFIPDRWEYKPAKGKESQLAIVKKLIGQASTLINAGDPDREGSYLVDSVIYFCGGSQKPVWRLLVADLNPKAVTKAIKNMDRSNSTKALSESAKARQYADYAYGLNLTMAYTLAAKKGGGNGVLSLGRVQTPVLGLVARRRLDRENFTPHPFYNIQATHKEAGIEFASKMKLVGAESFFDDEKRLTDRGHATELMNSAKGKPALVHHIESDKANSAAPRPFSLSELQKLANKKLGLSADETLKAAQSLYESQLTTYPRSDCQYISVELWEEAAEVLAALSSEYPSAAQADASIKHSCVNNGKIGAHHAIIPTGNISGLSGLATSVRALYDLIAMRYIALFYPMACDQKTTALLKIGNAEFVTKGVVELEQGWRKVLGGSPDAKKLPDLQQGQELAVLSLDLIESKTTPPDDFTEATLLGAMTNIAKHVANEDLKKVLKETDGLGTEATRASIIETLIKRGFIERKGKKILATDLGLAFIQQLPEQITLPDMTAQWEQQLSEITESKLTATEFVAGVVAEVEKLVAAPEINIEFKADQAEFQCPKCQSPLKQLTQNESKKKFWACSTGREKCDFVCNDNRNKPAQLSIHHCPDCQKELRRRKGGNGWFWSCVGFSDGCKYSCDDSRGKPKEAKPEQDCPDCGKPMFEKKGKYSKFLGCSGYPECKKTIKI